MLYTLSLCVTVFFLAVYVADCQTDGWKMTDRFYGFRYEAAGQGLTDFTILESIQAKANSMGCFGWVQVAKQVNIVGEGRCSKAKGKVFQDWLGALPGVTNFEVLVRLKF
jgi:hypothetical protein